MRHGGRTGEAIRQQGGSSGRQQSLLLPSRNDDRVEILPQDLLQAVRRERAIDDDAGIAGIEHDELGAAVAHGVLNGLARLPLVQHDFDAVARAGAASASRGPSSVQRTSCLMK